jgi:hypothetical protein
MTSAIATDFGIVQVGSPLNGDEIEARRRRRPEIIHEIDALLSKVRELQRGTVE